MSPPSPRNAGLMLVGFWILLLLDIGGLVLMFTVSIWVGVAVIAVASVYGLVALPRLRTRLGFNRWRGGLADRTSQGGSRDSL